MPKIFAYFGAKTHMLKDIYGFMAPIREETKCFVDVFGGSAAVILNLPNEWNCQRVYNDLDRNLFNTLNVFVTPQKRDELLKLLEFSFRSRDMFEQLKNPEFRIEGVPEDIFSAFRTVYLHQYSYSANGRLFRVDKSGQHDYMKSSLEGIQSLASEMRHGFIIENLDFRELIRKYDKPNTFFYLDPPYMMGQCYKHGFTKQDFNDLYGFCMTMKGKFLLNESERDFDFIKSLWGEPKYVGEYVNTVSKIRKMRREGYWTNW